MRLLATLSLTLAFGLGLAQLAVHACDEHKTEGTTTTALAASDHDSGGKLCCAVKAVATGENAWLGDFAHTYMALYTPAVETPVATKAGGGCGATTTTVADASKASGCHGKAGAPGSVMAAFAARAVECPGVMSAVLLAGLHETYPSCSLGELAGRNCEGDNALCAKNKDLLARVQTVSDVAGSINPEFAPQVEAEQARLASLSEEERQAALNGYATILAYTIDASLTPAEAPVAVADAG